MEMALYLRILARLYAGDRVLTNLDCCLVLNLFHQGLRNRLVELTE